MEKPTSEDSDCRCEASLVTVTEASAAPTFNCAVTVEVLATCTTMPTCLKLAKPAALTSSVYVPGGSSGNVNSPSELEVPTYPLPVLVSLRLRDAPETTEPLESFTIPVRVPRPDWAMTGIPTPRLRTTNSHVAIRQYVCALESL